MMRPGAGFLLLLAILLAGSAARGQTSAPDSPPKPARVAAKKPDDPVKAALGGSTKSPGEVITTEIYADEAFFDSAKHIGIFSGHVIVKDPRFNVQADKMTVYLAKNDAPTADASASPAPSGGLGGQGLEKAVAEGNVGVVRDRPGEAGQPPERSVGRSDMAIYTANDGKVELRGTPRVQSGMNTHIATSPDTVMIIDQTGQLVTKGPSRTEIRQEPKEKTPANPPAKP